MSDQSVKHRVETEPKSNPGVDFPLRSIFMSYRAITALTFGHAGDARAIAFAAHLGVNQKARVEVFPYLPDPALDLISYGMLLGTTLPAETAETILASQQETRIQLEALCRRACNDADLIFGDGDGAPRMVLSRPAGRPETALSHALALTDLVVISDESLKASPAARDAFAQALLQQRTPVLLCRGEPTSLESGIIIAWDGSAEAGRAVRQALPLIAMGSGAVAVQCRQGLDKVAANPSFDPLIAYLHLHGAGDVRCEVVAEGPETVGLVQTARRLKPGLLISGAYGHTRLREALFGGTTRALLDDADGPTLFLAH